MSSTLVFTGRDPGPPCPLIDECTEPTEPLLTSLLEPCPEKEIKDIERAFIDQFKKEEVPLVYYRLGREEHTNIATIDCQIEGKNPFTKGELVDNNVHLVGKFADEPRDAWIHQMFFVDPSCFQWKYLMIRKGCWGDDYYIVSQAFACEFANRKGTKTQFFGRLVLGEEDHLYGGASIDYSAEFIQEELFQQDVKTQVFELVKYHKQVSGKWPVEAGEKKPVVNKHFPREFKIARHCVHDFTRPPLSLLSLPFSPINE